MEKLITNSVPPSGSEDSSILFVADSPSEVDSIKLTPFLDQTGQFFLSCLRTAYIIKSDIRVDFIFNKRPLKGKVNYFFSNATNTILNPEGLELVEEFKQRLCDLLDNREQGYGGPNVIVALGPVALFILTGKKRINKWRGSLLDCILVPGFKVYPTFHPSHVVKLMNEKTEQLYAEKKIDQQNILPLFLCDIKRIKDQAAFPEIKKTKRTFDIFDNPDLSPLVAKFKKLLNQAEQKNLYIACDIETLPGKDGPILWCIGFAPTNDYAFTIAILKDQSFVWSEQQEAIIWSYVSKIFLHPKIKIIFHNGMYDLSVLGRYYGIRVSRDSYEDTQYAHQMNYPFLRKSLAMCTSIYTWEPYYKDSGKDHLGNRSDRQEYIYNCRDCVVTREVFFVLMRDMEELETGQNYIITKSVVSSLLHMVIKGVRINIKKKEQLKETFTRLANEYEANIRILADKPELNLRSPTQLKKLFYGILECEPQYNRKTGKLSTDKDAIIRLLKYYRTPGEKRHDILINLVNFRAISKLNDTYANMTLDSDGRVRTSYGWVTTFRLNSTKSHFGEGGNLQNIPQRSEEGKEIRRLFIPDKGKIFVRSDLAQAEAREVVWLANDKVLKEAFLNNWDIHWARTKAIFKFDEQLEYEAKKVISDIYTKAKHTMKFYRDLGKTIVHAGNYKMGPAMLQTILARQGVDLILTVCKKLLAANIAANPLVRKWQEETILEVKANRMLTTALGDRRYFRGRMNEALYRSAIAFRPQSVVGRILQIATQRIQEELNDVFDVLLNVHDEIIGQCYEKDLPELLPEMKSRIEIPHVVNGDELVIPCDFKIGYSWEDCIEVEI